MDTPKHCNKAKTSRNNPRPPVFPAGRRTELDATAVSEKMAANASARPSCSAFMLLAPFLDGGKRILDVFFRVGIGIGVKNFSVRRNHIGNAVGEGRAAAACARTPPRRSRPPRGRCPCRAPRTRLLTSRRRSACVEQSSRRKANYSSIGVLRRRSHRRCPPAGEAPRRGLELRGNRPEKARSGSPIPSNF
jgi:hypothetical protein